eukprot:m.57695 g.57695  ORF g.57695 m.57695 type:complete len:525 (+) comp11618_c0_seq2:138-1712(+)
MATRDTVEEAFGVEGVDVGARVAGTSAKLDETDPELTSTLSSLTPQSSDDMAAILKEQKLLKGKLQSAKAELIRVRTTLLKFQTKHNKQMEHLRFLLTNRINAKGQSAPATTTEGGDDGDALGVESGAALVDDLMGESEQARARKDRKHRQRILDRKAELEKARPLDGGDLVQMPLVAPASAPVTEGASLVPTATSLKAHTAADALHQDADWKEAMKPIGYIQSCFKRKNGTPRQPNLCATSVATLKVTSFDNSEHAVQDLKQYSHVWIIFLFHLNDNVAVKPKIRPPKLNGTKISVMATRSPHRPNPIGLSLVQLADVRGDTLILNAVDLVHGTPVLDVKPYIPFYDMPITPVRIAPWVTDAKSRQLEVAFEPHALEQMEALAPKLALFPNVEEYKEAVTSILRADPRSGYRRGKCQADEYAFTLDNTDVHVFFFTHEGQCPLATGSSASTQADGAQSEPAVAASSAEATDASVDGDIAPKSDVSTPYTCAHVLRINEFIVKKERTVGHLSDAISVVPTTSCS